MEKIRKLLTAAIFIILFISLSCDSLISPIKERLNPNDSSSPLPLPSVFNASVEDDGTGRLGTLLYWEEAQLESEVKTEGFIIVRKAGEIPLTIWDGDFVCIVFKGDIVNEYFDHFDDVPDFPYGRRVFYSIFTFGPKWENMNEDEILAYSYDDIKLYNSSNYNFAGPKYAFVNVYDSIDLSVVNDEYMTSISGWVTGTDSLIVDSSSATPSSIACIEFDLTDTPDANIEYAFIVLEITIDSISEGDIIAEALELYWPDVTSFDSLRDNSTFFSNTVLNPGISGDELWIDITGAFNVWNWGVRTNYGIKISTIADPDPEFSFSSSEGLISPRLRLFYWVE